MTYVRSKRMYDRLRSLGMAVRIINRLKSVPIAMTPVVGMANKYSRN